MHDSRNWSGLLIVIAGWVILAVVGEHMCAIPKNGKTGSGCEGGSSVLPQDEADAARLAAEASSLVLEKYELGRGPWATFNPFLFCVYHHDNYPAGDQEMGVQDRKLLKGRSLGSDFSYQEGWSMYHGERIPGFPAHPHRGFETITYTRKGFVDHTDSAQGAGRYGEGDIQWMTAGKGLQHAEMFPLLNANNPNPLELFQIWLNLPAKDKMVEATFAMLWAEDIPSIRIADGRGKITTVTICAGSPKYFPHEAQLKIPTPTPNSWASNEENDVVVWTIKLDPGARFTIPAALLKGKVNRAIYFFSESDSQKSPARIQLSEFSYDNPRRSVLTAQALPLKWGAKLNPAVDILIETYENGGTVELLMLQGRPIPEPTVSHGPFVMNSQEEIQQAMADFQRTQFGGWPYGRSDPVQPRDKGRFALYPNGTEVAPPKRHRK